MKIIFISLFFFTQIHAENIMHVWKSPSCMCCEDWIKYLEENKFKVIKHNSGNTMIKEKLGIDESLSSCHTGIIDRYLIEGHVPIKDIKKLLNLRPKNAIGLSVPEMQIGSPGIDKHS